MGTLQRSAYVIGVKWAEQTFGRLCSRGDRIPEEWPGTAAQAIEFVATDDADQFEVEELAFEVNHAAREAWRELVW